jgi:hypothetical protein
MYDKPKKKNTVLKNARATRTNANVLSHAHTLSMRR